MYSVNESASSVLLIGQTRSMLQQAQLYAQQSCAEEG